MAITIPYATQLTLDPYIRNYVGKRQEPVEIPQETTPVKSTFGVTNIVNNPERIVGYTRGGTPITALEARFMELSGQRERINYVDARNEVTGRANEAFAISMAEKGVGLSIQDPSFYDRIEARENQRIKTQAEKAVSENYLLSEATAIYTKPENAFRVYGYGYTGGMESIKKNVLVPEMESIIKRRETEGYNEFVVKTAWSSTPATIAKYGAGFGALGVGAGLVSKAVTVSPRIALPVASALAGAGVGLEAVKLKQMKEVYGKTNVDIGAELVTDIVKTAIAGYGFSKGYEAVVGKPIPVIETRYKGQIQSKAGKDKVIDYGSFGEVGIAKVQGKTVKYRASTFTESEGYLEGSKAFGTSESYTTGARQPLTMFERFTGEKKVSFTSVGKSMFSGDVAGTQKAGSFIGKVSSKGKVADIGSFEIEVLEIPKTGKTFFVDYGINTEATEGFRVMQGWGVLKSGNKYIGGEYLRSIETIPEKTIVPFVPRLLKAPSEYTPFTSFSTGKTAISSEISVQKLGQELATKTASVSIESGSLGLEKSITGAVSRQKILTSSAFKIPELLTTSQKTSQKLDKQPVSYSPLSIVKQGEKTAITPVLKPVLSQPQKQKTNQLVPAITITTTATNPIPPSIPTFFPAITPPIPPPLFDLPSMDFDFSGGLRKRKLKKRKGRYLPSLGGTYFNLRGKPSFKEEKTGLGYRRIISKARVR